MTEKKPKQPKKKPATKPTEPNQTAWYVCVECDRRYLQTYAACPVCGGSVVET
jgi:hypothetical protein